MKITVCIPTYNRPKQVSDLLTNLLEQQVLPEEVVLVDSSSDDASREIAGKYSDRFPSLVYQRSEKGLTLQRNRAIEMAHGDIVVFLDDDVLLEPEFLLEVKKVFEKDEEGLIGGIAGVLLNQPPYRMGAGWRLKRLLGIIETDTPGRLLACGETTSFPRPSAGEMVRTDFLPGGLTAWHRKVLEEFRFSLFFQGYGLGEDKYFSACVGKVFELFVSGDIKGRHLHVDGNRPNFFQRGYYNIYNHYFIMNECSAGGNNKLRFFLFHLMDAINDMFTWPFRKQPGQTLFYGLGRIAGILKCLLKPPVMEPDDPAWINRRVIMELSTE